MIDLFDLHTHTIASGHSYNTLYEMVSSASKKGLALYGCSDHAPNLPGSTHPFYFINFKVIPRNLFGIHVLMGAELNILDYHGQVDLKPHFLKGLDYAIASIHEPCYKNGTMEENTNAYLGALTNPYIHIIGHPDDGRFPFDYEAVVACAAKNHKLLEVNNTSLTPTSPRNTHAKENYTTMLALCRKYKTSIIINSDAHIEADIGNHTLAIALLKELDFPEELIVNTSLEKLAAYIPKVREYL